MPVKGVSEKSDDSYGGNDDSVLNAHRSMNVFVMPRLKYNDEKLNVLVLADGNNRANGLNKGYEAGGKNVVKIAEYAAIRGDVAKLVACIMSSENAEKRGDDFFWKLYQAFLGLGVNIDSKGVLVDKGIVMSVDGRLDELAKKSKVTKDLVDMIKTVCRRTQRVLNPSMELVLGVNYDDRIALDHDVDINYRSGMEEKDVLRLSGLCTHEGISNYSSTVLWPNVTREEIGSCIDHFKVTSGRRFSSGYSHSDWELFCRKVKHSQLDKSIYSFFPVRRRNVLMSYSNNVRAIDIVNDAWLDDINFDAFIAPGQKGNGVFFLPMYPSLGYSNLHVCDSDMDSVVKAMADSVSFDRNHQRLKGSERVFVEKESFKNRKEYFENLFSEIKRHDNANSLYGLVEKGDISCLDKNQSDYYQMLDLFSAKMMHFASLIGASVDKREQFQALSVYIAISFYLAYNPKKLQQDKEKQYSKNLSELVAKYMSLIYAIDEGDYDRKVPGETKEQKCQRIKETSFYYKNLILGDFSGEQTEEMSDISKRARGFVDCVNEYGLRDNVRFYELWKKYLDRFFTAAYNEVVVGDMVSKDLSLIKTGFTPPDVIISNDNSCLRKRLKAICGKKLEGDDLKEYVLNKYLLEINESIGAGLVYRTAALAFPESEFTEERSILLNQISELSNCCNRLANDIAGFRNSKFDDIDEKDDAIILLNKLCGDGSSDEVLKNFMFIRKAVHLFEAEFEDKLKQLSVVWPEMAVIINRAKLGIEIYKKNHIRNVDNEELKTYINEFSYLEE